MTQHLIGVILVVLGGGVLATESSAQDALSDRMRDCASLDDKDARVRCYDALADRNTHETGDAQQTSADAPVNADMADVDPDTANASPDMDEFGREQLPEPNEADNVEYSARVTGCENTQSGQVYFFLENGQIWKQKDYKKLRYRNCDFDVTLTRDLFGYKLKIVDTKSSFRVARVK